MMPCTVSMMTAYTTCCMPRWHGLHDGLSAFAWSDCCCCCHMLSGANRTCQQLQLAAEGPWLSPVLRMYMRSCVQSRPPISSIQAKCLQMPKENTALSAAWCVQIYGSVLPDGLHPNAEGLDRLASCLAPAIYQHATSK